jgi:hypothetical protein
MNLHGGVSGGSGKVGYKVNASKLQDGQEEAGGEIDLTTFDGGLSFQATDALDIRLFAKRNHCESSSFPETSGGIRLATTRTLETRDAYETTYGGRPTERPVRGRAWPCP